jgi:hypothetical protein
MKLNIEFNNVADDQKYLNFWNWDNGDDVCCEIKDGKLFLMNYILGSDEPEYVEISLVKFLEMVEERGNQIYKKHE